MCLIKARKYKKLDYLFSYDLMDFWRKVKSMQRTKDELLIDIEVLKNEYSSLFNENIVSSNNDNSVHENKVINFMNNFKNQIFSDEEVGIDETALTGIIKKLPNGKSAGPSGTTYEMIKYGIEPVKFDRHTGNKTLCYLMIMLVLMYKTIFKYSVIPDGLNDAIIHPLLKDRKKSSEDKSNYRPISLSEPFGGIFEKISNRIIIRTDFGDKQQFGFRSNSSCQHAIFCLNEAIRHSKNNDLELFLVAIDASKAFDKVNRVILFSILIDFLPAYLVKAIIVYYSKSRSKVRLNGKCTLYFITTRGVKQGGQMSPTLFTIYVHPVIKKIIETNHGVHIQINLIICIILYADDILLSSNSFTGMRIMLKVIEEFGLQFEIKFNGDKTQLMVVNYKYKEIYNLELNGKQLERVNVMKYLGVLIQDNYKNDLHLEDRVSKLNKAFNSIRTAGVYNSQLSVKLISRLYMVYLRPILTYGLDVISLTKTQEDDLSTIETNMIKKMLGISKCCHHSELLRALYIKDFHLNLKISKLNLVLRLLINTFTKEILVQRIKQTAVNKLINMNDIWNDVWLWIEDSFEADFGVEDIIEALKIKMITEKLNFKHSCEHDNYIDEIRGIFQIDSAYLRRKTLQERLIPIAIVLNE
jgi:hypothetical protein